MMDKKQVGIGAGALAAAAAAAAAGYYFYASKDAPKHRRIATRWASGLKREALREVKRLKQLDRAQVMSAIDAATAAYETARSVDPKELMRAARELKNNWRDVVTEATGGSTRRPAKKSAPKRATKKAAKKRARRA